MARNRIKSGGELATKAPKTITAAPKTLWNTEHKCVLFLWILHEKDKNTNIGVSHETDATIICGELNSNLLYKHGERPM